MDTGRSRETDMGQQERGNLDLRIARLAMERADQIAAELGRTPDTARLMVEIAREYREIAMAQSYLDNPLPGFGEAEGGEAAGKPEPTPVEPQAVAERAGTTGPSPAPLAPVAPQTGTARAVADAESVRGVGVGSDAAEPADGRTADSSPGADEVCADLMYRDADGVRWRRVADHDGMPVMREWIFSRRVWGSAVRMWFDLVSEYGPISRGELL